MKGEKHKNPVMVRIFYLLLFCYKRKMKLPFITILAFT